MSAVLRTAIVAVLCLATLPVAAQNNTAIVGGTAFLDRNRNGAREATEPRMQAMVKVTSGGDYFACASTAENATFGVVVTPGKYWVMPVAPAGFHTTTPILAVNAEQAGGSYRVNIGFAPNPAAQPDSCDAYHPRRVIRESGLGLIETLTRAGDFNRMLRAIDAAGLFDTLAGAPGLTLFALRDDAFPQKTEAEFAQWLTRTDAVKSTLRRHVLSRSMTGKMIFEGRQMRTLDDASLRLGVERSVVVINSARVIAADIPAANGVIHVIDRPFAP
jgi:uncharacterized surface protein with fasciclin (FAS1) repeats